MEPSLPISSQQVSAVGTPEIQVLKDQGVAVAMEHKLVEYIARLQVQGVYGQQFSNPAALSSEVLNVLKGYMERASKLEQMAGGKASGMNDGPMLTLASNEGGVQTASYAPGPAERQLEPLAPVEGGLQTLGAAPIGGAELERAIQLLSQLLSFSFETSFIGTATTNVSKSANTLLHGQ